MLNREAGETQFHEEVNYAETIWDPTAKAASEVINR